MKKTARWVALTTAALTLLVGCSPGPAGPAGPPVSGGAPTSVPKAPAPATDAPVPAKPTPEVTTFADIYRTERLEVQVTRITRSTLPASATAHGVNAHGVKAGSPVQRLTIRVVNHTDTPVVTTPQATMTYGKSARRAPAVHFPDGKGIAKTIPAGGSTTGTYGFAVPQKYLWESELRFRVAANQPAATFRGSLDYSPRNGTTFNDPTGSKAKTLAITTQIEKAIDAAPPGSTIRIAHYSFDITKSADKIAAAYKRGVNVQMIVDQHNQIVTKQTTAMMSLLGTKESKQSFIVRCRASCMSNHASAMHAKFYLFEQAGSSKLVSMVASANLTHTNSQGSWNDLQTIVGDATIYDSLKKYFDDMVPDKNRPNYYRTTTSGPYKLYFFPRASQKRVVLLAALDKVTCTGAAPGYGTRDGRTVVRVMMYSWRGPRIDIAKKLWSLQNAGCEVQIILNRGRTDLAIRDVLTRKTAEHGRIWIGDAWVDRNGNNVAERYMHQKGITINGVWSGQPNTKVVYSGSQNFAPASTTDNNELILRHFSDATYDAYSANFAYIREHGTRPMW